MSQRGQSSHRVGFRGCGNCVMPLSFKLRHICSSGDVKMYFHEANSSVYTDFVDVSLSDYRKGDSILCEQQLLLCRS